MTTQPEQNTPKPKANRSGALSFIQPRETRRTIKARGPRRVANFLRVAMPLLALVLLAALVVWPVLRPNEIVGVVLKNAPDLVVKNLHFTGLSSKNEPYSISAVKATRPGGVPNIYDLDKPEAETTLKTGAWIAAQAQFGRYDQDTHQLWLGGDVQVFHDNGYEFTSDEAQVDLKRNFAWGNKPVLIQGPFGEIRGDGGFELLDSGHVMVVKGPAKAVLNLQGGGVSGKPKPVKP